MLDIRQLLQLKIRGLSNRKAAEVIGIHRNSIDTYLGYFKSSDKGYKDLLALSDSELQAFFPISDTRHKDRYETLSGYFSYFRQELKKPGCTRDALWKEYLERHPDGYGRTQFNEHLNRWLKQVKASGKLEHKAGDKVYVDFTGKKLSYVDQHTGELIDVEVFVGILPCSGYTFVEACASQQLEDFIGCMNNCLHYFGGSPKAIVPDNLKSAVSKGSKYEPVLNRTFKGLALHYGTAINPTRPYAPQDKALVEGAVKLVYQRIFYPMSEMTFFSLSEINAVIKKLLKVYNDRPLSQLNMSRLEQFRTIEAAYLDPLPAEAYELRKYRRATVQKMGYVFVSEDKNYYSVPYRFIGKKVEVSYTARNVEVHYQSERIATHPRSQRAGHYVTIKEHLCSTHKFYQNWSPAFFEKLARPHGEPVVQYVKAVIEQADYPEIAYKQCLGIIALGKTYSKKRLQNACRRGLQFRRCGYSIIKNILTNNMDKLEESPPDADTNPTRIPHKNIRGKQYYN